MGISTIPVFAQETIDEIIVATDKESYKDEETITITGTVKNKFSGYDVLLQVFTPTGNLVTAQQLAISEDNTFGIDMTTGGPLWRAIGTYTVKVTYGPATQSAETVFAFDRTPTDTNCRHRECWPTPDNQIDYKIKGGKILSVIPDVSAHALIMDLETTSDGEVTITFPRDIIDARDGPDGKSGNDVDFYIFVDGMEPDFEEIRNSENRTLTISFKGGTSQIEIYGTWVIPEFGTIAITVLIVSLLSIVVMSRIRFRFYKNYSEFR